MTPRFFFRAAGLALAATLAVAPAVARAKALIRDAEIETDIHKMMTPIWRVAGLDPNAVHVYLIEDNRINSFVAGGQNIFVNTGTIMNAKTPNMLIGVLAHETGHIALGHLVRSEQAMKNASIEGILAMAVGLAAAVASRSEEGGAAVLPAGLVAERAWLKYSVVQEASADQAALSYLDLTHQSARGLLEFFEKLQGEELLDGADQDPYLRDHPLTRQRIAYVREHVEHSPYSNVPDPPAYVMMLERIKAKLGAFLSPPSTTLARYPETDKSLLARYARAIAYYRIPELEKALHSIDTLIRDYPRDPYFEELKGQMLFENGHVKQAVAPYDAAVRLDPSAALLRIERAQVDLESHEPQLNKIALADLTDAVQSESESSEAWRLLAIAYGRDGKIGQAALALAEQGLAEGNKKNAMLEADRAEQLFPKSSPFYARAEEIKREAKEIEASD